MSRNFRRLLETRWSSGCFVCVGLDSEYAKIPKSVQKGRSISQAIVEFNRAIVDATKDLVCAYKPNLAFYSARGVEGMSALYLTILMIHEIAPNVPIILDAKYADIGNTNNGYVETAFEYLQADAVTIHPTLGKEAVQPFLDRVDKGIIVLCRTSNSGAGEFQDLNTLMLNPRMKPERMTANDWLEELCNNTMPLYERVAMNVSKHWNKNGNCALVVGATFPEELAKVRQLIGDMPILVPGIGTQGGDVEKTIKASKDSQKQGMIINSSRGIIFASKGEDFAQAARHETLSLAEQINQYR